ncbi:MULTISPECIES: aldose 1-epimerase family protein [unclassified Sphingomonas]|jgi:galactose mutarotase-like enzyme|uniref:aldose 1-epimerase family protein n=1 Tax=unclassified Sphingomonas TaxID=196159 RepID=UPI000E107644|nr:MULTISPECIES: aldose 1-epimerase family protein [unclassified Sphingomonas]AXJ95372.1 aldose 1-epimerase family protein [Sphingomonas sp. FARSPH]
MTDPQMIRITSGALTAAINSYGAELTHLTDAQGRELMTDADPAFWTGHAPILFPVIGVTNGLQIHLDGATYPMPKHGFARHSLFDVVEASDSHAVFALEDSDQTRSHYPFAFRLEITFSIEDTTLSVEARIVNRNDAAMPASFGFHPAFAWPLPYGHDRADHRIVFAADEPGALREIAPDGLIAAATRPSPLDGRTLQLRDDLFTDDALVWDHVRSQAVTYGASEGPELHVAFPDTPKLGIWTKPGAAYVCIEPWHGIADPEGYAGDFRAKPGVFEIAPGDTKHIRMKVTLTA